MVLGLARRRGIEVDSQALEGIMVKSFSHLADLDRAVQGSHLVDPVLTMALALAPADALGLPHSASTGAYARLIASGSSAMAVGRPSKIGHHPSALSQPPHSRCARYSYSCRKPWKRNGEPVWTAQYHG